MSPGRREAGQRGQRQVGGATHAGLQHPAAPDRHALRAAQVVDGKRLAQSAHPPGLDVDHPARPHLQRLAGVPRREDALVQADRRLELGLQPAVVPQVVLRQRLLDQQQVQIIQRQQAPRRFRGYRPSWRRPAGGCSGRRCARPVHRPHRARLDLDLDAAVALRQVALNTLTSASGESWMPTDTPTATFFAHAAQQLAQRAALPLPCRSHSAISRPAFAIGWPRTQPSGSAKSAGPPAPASRWTGRGIAQQRQAVATVS